MDFFEWSTLATFSGSLTMVVVITQFTKNIKYIKNIPTQLWSYIVSLAVLFPTYYFMGKLNTTNIVLVLFNGIVVALAANGGFEALKNILPNKNR
jgi:hypothetical protein